MDISVNGKSLDVGEALRGYAAEALETTVAKYFDRAIDANVTISREAYEFRADISVHALRSLLVQGSGRAADPYAAFDAAVERIAKQLRRYKRWLRDHHRRRGEEPESPAQHYVIQSDSEEAEDPANGQPAIIAELPTTIATLTVGEAVMRLDLGDASAMMFRNRAHGGLNVVYRRSDGNIGWIDPTES